MELKTKIHAEDGKQELTITRVFDLPLELLFKAHTDPQLIARWMGTRVMELENEAHGSWRYETADPAGNIVFRAHGVIHEFVPNKKITRTFEMEGAPFGPQLEFFDFEKLTEDTSKLIMHLIFRSVALRDQILKLPFARGLNMAHDRLQEITEKQS